MVRIRPGTIGHRTQPTTAATLELPTTQTASRRRHACTSYWQTEDCVYECVFSYPTIIRSKPRGCAARYKAVADLL